MRYLCSWTALAANVPWRKNTPSMLRRWLENNRNRGHGIFLAQLILLKHLETLSANASLFECTNRASENGALAKSKESKQPGITTEFVSRKMSEGLV